MEVAAAYREHAAPAIQRLRLATHLPSVPLHSTSGRVLLLTFPIVVSSTIPLLISKLSSTIPTVNLYNGLRGLPLPSLTLPQRQM